MTNKEAYDLLARLGHNWAVEPFDPKLWYVDEAIEAYRDMKR